MEIALAIGLPVAAVAMLAVLILCIMKRCHNIKMKNLKATLNPFREVLAGAPWDTNLNGDAELLEGIRFRPVGDSTLRDLRGEEESLTSGSGSGRCFVR